MPYTKTTWVNGQPPAINDTNLNKIEVALEYSYGGAVPVGGIIAWAGVVADIPSNWSLCDGSNGTPDLRNKFIAGSL